ncbi:sugar ABC transporter substrate-binding protein [Amycolatopsis acidiphila]|uniref:Sugar ABC transporter substrate-binding protein n=1 Tax=Amycolatopsis acidiphila TaxID=715473 RepID=A0A558AGE3_9PSEU|nr:sugar ABC transporter substrate-binding protein [Amycolatopsis acidiphila]TVT23337.1 sugar ABC transporter substrate-binding protein [Amycolatopsis acidiphila]UIJ56566.1 sugar ABC transporter substrate-binding protein [Amycolatopsis acidiphila]
MRTSTRVRSALLTMVVSAALLTACGSGGQSGPGGQPTITYWASDQGSSIAEDVKVLTPELDAFTRQTGIKVNLEVIGWSDLLNRILAAATSGQGPDVVNIGNTWSTSLQATGAFLPISADVLNQIGGTGRFLPNAIAATGAPGKDPVGVPLYSLAYALYYNKAMFAAAGIQNPPATWEEFVADGKLLTHAQQWGVSVEGASTSENAHHAFTFSQQQGGGFFDASGKPTFNTPQNVAAIKQYVDFVAADKIANPSDAEYSNGTEAVQDFATGKAAMMLWQTADAQLGNYGMDPAQYGVVPVPFPASPPSGARHVDSIVAGINMAVFAATRNQDAALQFVKFMTSRQTQIDLNKAYSSLPSVTDAYSDPAFQTPTAKTYQQILTDSAAPMPAVTEESQFETAMGTVLKNLFADAASGKAVTEQAVATQLDQAQQQLNAGG